MATFELDTDGLSAEALSMLRAAINHAQVTPAVVAHAVPLATFYEAAGLPVDMATQQVRGVVKELSRALICSHDFEAGSFREWLAFEVIKVTEADVEFKLCPYVLNATEPSDALAPGMAQLNLALAIAVSHAGGNAEAFAFQLTAAFAGLMGQGMLNEDTGMKCIQLLHELHPSISV